MFFKCKGGSGSNVTIDGVEVEDDLALSSGVKYENKSVSTLPYSFYYGCAVVQKDEIHIMSTTNSSSYYKYHYKYNGTSWTKLSDLPYSFCLGSAVVHQDTIHILGSSDGNYTNHYAIQKPIYVKGGAA